MSDSLLLFTDADILHERGQEGLAYKGVSRRSTLKVEPCRPWRVYSMISITSTPLALLAAVWSG